MSLIFLLSSIMVVIHVPTHNVILITFIDKWKIVLVSKSRAIYCMVYAFTNDQPLIPCSPGLSVVCRCCPHRSWCFHPQQIQHRKKAKFRLANISLLYCVLQTPKGGNRVMPYRDLTTKTSGLLKMSYKTAYCILERGSTDLKTFRGAFSHGSC